MASQVSLPSTPQQNTSYDTYMQSLQQKLSSISMQNAATLLHVDSSAPTSGTTTTEMLSPVQEFETVQFAVVASPTETTPKHQNYKNLNNELTKINSRKDCAAPNPPNTQPHDVKETIELQQTEIQNKPNDLTTNDVAVVVAAPAAPEKLEKTRRVSRFKVSVVAEPDPTKLIIKPDEPEETVQTAPSAENDHHLKQVPSLQDIPSSLEGVQAALDAENHVELNDSLTIINNTMLQLQENVQTSYLSQAKSLIAAVPSGWTTENQHAVGIPATIGNTAHVKIERKISMDNLKTKTTTTTTLKKSLSYNDLANEIANLFSKPSPTKSKQNTITGRVDPVVTNSNPRKISGNGRRMSKTFRRTPTIIIHPPDENCDRITNSCPNIHALIFKENGGVSSLGDDAHERTTSAVKDELNHSCPDINVLLQSQDEYIDNNPINKQQNSLSKSCPSINTLNENIEVMLHKYEPLNISFSECLNELDALKNEVNDIKKECECLLFCDAPPNPPNAKFKFTSKRKLSQKLVYKYVPNRPERKTIKQDTYTRTVSEPNITTNKKSPKKPEYTPTELLKHKIKQSLSMYDLNAPAKHDHSYDNYFTVHGGMKFPNHLHDFTHQFKREREHERNKRELDKDNNLLAIVKCCCGLENCQNGRLQVVPITFQQLMDFNCEYNMNETFEDMLGRQQAELNALIEAHRKQQIEYMKSITETNRKDNF